MPLYEYKCKKCGFMFEILQKPNAKPLKNCVQCGGEVEKIISPPAIQFKGSGWYVTDYAQKQQPPSEKKDESEKGSSQSEGEKTTEKSKSSEPQKKDSSSKKTSSSPSSK